MRAGSCLLLLWHTAAAWRRTDAPTPVARRRFVGGAFAAVLATPRRARAYNGQTAATPKATKLPPKELAARVERDLVENQCGPGAVDGVAPPPRRRRREDPPQVPRDGKF